MAVSLVIFDANGVIDTIVHGAQNLDDPAWNPDGFATVQIDKDVYDTCTDNLDIYNEVLNIVQPDLVTSGQTSSGATSGQTTGGSVSVVQTIPSAIYDQMVAVQAELQAQVVVNNPADPAAP